MSGIETTETAGSKEAVAFKLMVEIAKVDGASAGTDGPARRKWILDTYAECLIATKGLRKAG